MTKLLLIKHAAPVISDLPARDWPLSDVGRLASRRLGAALAAFDPVAIYSSDEPKAAETARIAAQVLGMAATVRVNLHEHDQTGTPFLDREAFEARVRSLFETPDVLAYGRETGAQARHRFGLALEPLLARHFGQTLAVVAHGRVISLYVAQHCGLKPLEGFALWRSLGMPGIVELDIGAGASSPHMHLIDDIA